MRKILFFLFAACFIKTHSYSEENNLIPQPQKEMTIMYRHIVLLLLSSFLCLPLSAEKTIKVACVGNSITYGYGIENRETNSYPAQLQLLLGNGYEVENFGKSGATLINKAFRPYTQQEEYQKALNYAADRVIIHLGINDTDPRSWPNYRDDFVQDYLSLIDSFKKANPNCKVWICLMSPITHAHHRFKSGTRDWYWMIQSKIKKIADLSNATLIDLNEPLYNRPDLLPDALHPTAEGAKIMAETIYKYMTGNFGGLQMPIVYSDNMVLQREKELELEGTANAGETVTVQIAGQTKTVTAGYNGKWKVVLAPLQTATNLTLNISAQSRNLKYRNVAVGEVWLCSGQSNMAFKTKEMDKDERRQLIHYANKSPQIRLFNMEARWQTNAVEWEASVLDSLNDLKYFNEPKWQLCDENSADNFSAIAMAFGQMLSDSISVPIGLICNAVGGSATESWIDRKTLEFEFPDILHDWKNNDFIQGWVRERASLNIKASKNTSQRHPYEPCYLFESGILPLGHFPIKGVIWYQGESNAHNIEVHERLFPLLINSWRTYWNEEVPFYFVQLSSLNRPSWTWFRDSQRRLAEQITSCEMAVSSDRGDSLDVHPKHKLDIGGRLAKLALCNLYGKTSIMPSGPMFQSVTVRGDSLIIAFRNAKGLKASDEMPLRSFEVAGDDEHFYPAQAEIIDDEVKIWNTHVKQPKYARYGWQPFTRANLVNGENLPASTFQTEIKNENNMIQHNRLPDLPGMEQTAALGVSAPFVGVIDNYLIVAGGCNFPDKPVAEGGAKRYYSDILAIDLENEKPEWKFAGKLPHAASYGASVSTPQGIVCIGGNNENASFSDVYILKWNESKTQIEVGKMPKLPAKMDNLSAACLDGKIYAAGGNENGKPCNSMYCLDISKQTKWQRLPDFPGPARVQPALTQQQSSDGFRIYISGGFQQGTAKTPPQIPTDILSYSPTTKEWRNETLLPPLENNKKRTLTGGNAIAYNDNSIIYFGGVNYDCFLAAIDRPRQIALAQSENDNATVDSLQTEAKNYMNHPIDWYKFNNDILRYDTNTGKWATVGSCEFAARAGAGAVIYKNKLIIINGELKPGIRTPKVNVLTLPE